ncbi:MAG: hypothetical protein K5664_01840 [Firmicutes bacterium]|nr:hypothetical protein [Bacillota bacterium]
MKKGTERQGLYLHEVLLKTELENVFQDCHWQHVSSFKFIISEKITKSKGIGAYISDYSAYPKQYEFIIKRGVKFKINEAYEKEMYMWENGIRKLKKRRVFELIFLDD